MKNRYDMKSRFERFLEYVLILIALAIGCYLMYYIMYIIILFIQVFIIEIGLKFFQFSDSSRKSAYIILMTISMP